MDPQTLFLDWNTVLVDGYNPHLTDAISSQSWTPRSPNTPLNVCIQMFKTTITAKMLIVLCK